MEIIPAILTSDPRELDKYLKTLRDGKKYTRVQVDFIDGKFVNNSSIRPSEVDLIPYLPLKYDAHLMVTEENALTWSKTAQAMGFNKVIIQVEKIKKPQNFKCLAFDLETPIDEKLLPKLELIIVMSVKAGFGGQEFDLRAIEKVKQIKKAKQMSGFNFEICVDGGIQPQHLSLLEEAGADSVAVGVERVLQWG